MKAFTASLMLFAAGLAFGQADEVARPDPQVEARLKNLAEELRCLVCQNQTIADSTAPLALDLRNQIRAQIAQGRSDEQVRDYMVARYGDFVLYRPPLRPLTLLLWVGPFALLALGAGVFLRLAKGRRSAALPAPIPNERRAEIESLLKGDVPLSAPPRPKPRRAR